MTAHAAIHAAIANAIKATGVVVRLEPGEWLSILKRAETYFPSQEWRRFMGAILGCPW